MEINIFITLVLAAFLISLSPGPAAITSVNHGITYGFKKTIPVIMGLQLGYIIQTFIVIVGLGAIIVKSVILFNIIKYMGIAYLLYLGLTKIFKKIDAKNNEEMLKYYNLKEVFTKALLINLINPKYTVFLVAFIPQFLDPDKLLIYQFLFIGLTLSIVDIIVMSSYSILASKFGKFVKDEKSIKVQNKVAGVFFIIAAFFLSFCKKA